MKVRIGIDVGGTFTDAVAIDNETSQLIGTLKVVTSHSSEKGVAQGIVDAVHGIMEKYKIKAEDVFFIAHGTTQATNALLEGDVSNVGVLSAGSGVSGMKVKSDTNIDAIELAPGKFLTPNHYYLDLKSKESIEDAIKILVEQNSEVIVASTAFAVDNPEVEDEIVETSFKCGLAATATSDVSKLYGLRVRTRTAVINASILPKMIETADMTSDSIKAAGITAPLMIMRCDGGVMNIEEVKTRPILTLLSGPAAGVAGTLMHEKISNGIFLEVGGTSTDISVIKDGKVMVDYAEIGGHKTYLNSLDVRTIGIAGGSMVRIDSKGVVDVGPRSAHIAGLAYSVYAIKDITNPTVRYFSPKPGDPSDYCSVVSNGDEYAITVSCAANILGYVKPEHYSFGNVDRAISAFTPIAAKLGITVNQLARDIMDKVSIKNKEVIERLIKEYKLDIDNVILVGGGGGASTTVPAFAEFMGLEFKIAKNAEVISPIGVALAMVRDVVERSIINPTTQDIENIKLEAERAVIQAGANPLTVEVHVEIDTSKNIVRATGTGATELRTGNISDQEKSEEEIKEIAKNTIKNKNAAINVIYKNDSYYFIQGIAVKTMFLFITKKEKPVRVIDRHGVVKLQMSSGSFETISAKKFKISANELLDRYTRGTDGGVETPMVWVFIGKKIVDFSGIVNRNHIMSLLEMEINGLPDDFKVTFLFVKRGQ